jgi:hypothetical protein
MNTSDDLQLKRYLRGLPLAEPPAELGARILARHSQRRWRRRWVVPLAIAASLALAALLPITLQRPSAPEAPVTSVTADPLVLAEIRALDRRLQSSYLLAGDSSLRDALWQARRQTEARLKSGAPAPRLVQL